MKSASSRYVVAAFLILFISLQTRAFQAKQPAFTIDIPSPSSTWSQGSHIRLDVRIKSQSKELLLLGSSRSRDGRSGITVRAANGDLVHRDFALELLGNPQQPIRFSGTGISIKPGGTSAEVVDLSAEYSLKNPGKYSIKVHKRDPLSNAQVFSNTVTIAVVP